MITRRYRRRRDSYICSGNDLRKSAHFNGIRVLLNNGLSSYQSLLPAIELLSVGFGGSWLDQGNVLDDAAIAVVKALHPG